MRIAMVGAKGIPVEAGLSGGIERVVEELSARLVKRGHRVTVYVRPYANPSHRKTWNGVRLITLPCIRRRHFETLSHVFLSTCHALWSDAEIIHYHGVGPSLFAWMPRVFTPRKRVVVTFHARDQFHESRHLIVQRGLAFGEWTSLFFPHATIAVSRVIQQFCKTRFHKQVTYIPNAVSLPPETGIGSDRVEAMGLVPGSYFFGFGRLVRFKAFDVAMSSFRGVKTTMLLAIAGAAGYDTQYAQRLLREAGKDPRVHLLGFRTGEDLKQLIAHAYAVIHPSRIEGMSLAVLEAMSYGKLVIMSDIPENREIADHASVCIPVDDDQAFEDAISWAVNDPAMVQERGQRARAFVAQTYTWPSVIEQIETVYQNVLRNVRVQ